MPVWFGCDVGKEYHRAMAVMDAGLFDYESVYNSSKTLTKKERLEYGESLMTVGTATAGKMAPVGNSALLCVNAALIRPLYPSLPRSSSNTSTPWSSRATTVWRAPTARPSGASRTAGVCNVP